MFGIFIFLDLWIFIFSIVWAHTQGVILYDAPKSPKQDPCVSAGGRHLHAAMVYIIVIAAEIIITISAAALGLRAVGSSQGL